MYAFRQRAPTVLEVARARTVTLEAYRDGALAVPSAGTFTLLDPSGVVVVDAQAVAIVSSVASVALTALQVPDSLPLGEGYQERWSLTMPDAVIYHVRRSAALARYALHPPLSDVDILDGEYSRLDDEFGGTRASLQGLLDEAWLRLMERLFQSENWPYLMISSGSLRGPLRELTLHLACKDLYSSSINGDRWGELQKHHWSQYQAEWSEMRTRWDHDHDGLADSKKMERGSGGVVHRHVGPYGVWRRVQDPRF